MLETNFYNHFKETQCDTLLSPNFFNREALVILSNCNNFSKLYSSCKNIAIRRDYNELFSAVTLDPSNKNDLKNILEIYEGLNINFCPCKRFALEQNKIPAAEPEAKRQRTE